MGNFSSTSDAVTKDERIVWHCPISNVIQSIVPVRIYTSPAEVEITLHLTMKILLLLLAVFTITVYSQSTADLVEN